MLLLGGAMTVREYWYINGFKLQSLSNVNLWADLPMYNGVEGISYTSLCALALIISEVLKGWLCFHLMRLCVSS